jgi:hypothetical protein
MAQLKGERRAQKSQRRINKARLANNRKSIALLEECLRHA